VTKKKKKICTKMEVRSRIAQNKDTAAALHLEQKEVEICDSIRGGGGRGGGGGPLTGNLVGGIKGDI